MKEDLKTIKDNIKTIKDNVTTFMYVQEHNTKAAIFCKHGPSTQSPDSMAKHCTLPHKAVIVCLLSSQEPLQCQK
jgi:hypothetical protein